MFGIAIALVYSYWIACLLELFILPGHVFEDCLVSKLIFNIIALIQKVVIKSQFYYRSHTVMIYQLAKQDVNHTKKEKPNLSNSSILSFYCCVLPNDLMWRKAGFDTQNIVVSIFILVSYHSFIFKCACCST